MKTTLLLFGQGRLVAFEVITIECRITGNNAALETGDGLSDMIHGQLPAADLEHLGKCRLVVRVFADDVEYRLMIRQTGFDRVDERLFGLTFQIRLAAVPELRFGESRIDYGRCVSGTG